MNANAAVSKDLFDNPLGTDGFEFVEFTSPEPERLKGLFELMGFTAVSRHRSKNVLRFRQGDINFILNMEPVGQPADFRADHGPSANAMAFRVKDAGQALKLAVERGAKAVTGRVGPMELNIPAARSSISSTVMARRRSTTSISRRSKRPDPTTTASA
jgi:4-hydroxyphenylpyruvate dioxygenase